MTAEVKDTNKKSVTQEKQQLTDKLNFAQTQLRELTADVKEIIRLIKVFKDTVGIPDNVNIAWAILNRKAILRLLQDIVKVLKTKNINSGL